MRGSGGPMGLWGSLWGCRAPAGVGGCPAGVGGGPRGLRGDAAGCALLPPAGGAAPPARSRREERCGAARPEVPRHVAAPGSGGRAAGPAAMSGGAEAVAAEAERRVRIVVEYW